MIGNPPYQEKVGEKKTQQIWPSFVFKGLQILKDGGKIAMIHPSRWRNEGGEGKKTQEILKTVDIEWLSIHSIEEGQKNFGGASTRYDMYVARKNNTPNFVTEIRGEDGIVFKSCIKKKSFIPNFQSQTLDRIIASKDEERVHWLYSTTVYEPRNEWMYHENNVETDEYRYPCIQSFKSDGSLTLRYSNEIRVDEKTNEPIHFGTPKVIFSVWQYIGTPIVDSDGKYGMTQNSMGIHDEDDILPLICKAMDSKRFRRVMEATCFTSEKWNRYVIKLFRKDFWKEFVDKNGNLIDENGNIIPEEETSRK